MEYCYLPTPNVFFFFFFFFSSRTNPFFLSYHSLMGQGQNNGLHLASMMLLLVVLRFVLFVVGLKANQERKIKRGGSFVSVFHPGTTAGFPSKPHTAFVSGWVGFRFVKPMDENVWSIRQEVIPFISRSSRGQ